MGPQIQWLTVMWTEDKVYCVILAPTRTAYGSTLAAPAFQPIAFLQSAVIDPVNLR